MKGGSIIILPYMIRQGEQQHITEEYVSVPPALTITDETGAIWTLGFSFGAAPRGEFAFNVLRNGQETGETASRIERRRGRIRIFTATGWKWLHAPASREQPTLIYAVGVRPVPPVPTKIVLYRNSIEPAAQAIVGGLHGGIVDFRSTPIHCAPGQWLEATCQPPCDGISVMAVVGDNVMRVIPVVATKENCHA